MKRSYHLHTIRLAVLAALAIPVATTVALTPPQPQTAPVDPATPLDTSAPPDAVPPADPMQATPPWAPPAPQPADQPPAQADHSTQTTGHTLTDAQGRDVRLNTHAPDSVVGDYQVDFASLDADGDGYVSRTEAGTNATLSAEFDGVDRNGDGRLDRAELGGWSR